MKALASKVAMLGPVGCLAEATALEGLPPEADPGAGLILDGPPPRPQPPGRHLWALGLECLADGAVGILAHETVRGASHGAIRAPKLFDGKGRPEPGGLHCPRIFGPVVDHACACGKYAHRKYAGITCEVCCVEVIRSVVRRERFAHINLPLPVVPGHLRPAARALLGPPADTLLESVGEDRGERLLAALERASVADRLAQVQAPDARAQLLAMARSRASPSDLAWRVVLVLPPGLRLAPCTLDVSYLLLLSSVWLADNEIARVGPGPGLVSAHQALVKAVDRVLMEGRVEGRAGPLDTVFGGLVASISALPA